MMEETKEKTADLSDHAKDLVDHLEDLAQTYYRLAIVNATQKASEIASGAVAMILLIVFAFFILLFGGLALGWWLGTLLDNRALGFVLAAAFFLLLAVCVVVLKKKTIVPLIRNMVIRKLHE